MAREPLARVLHRHLRPRDLQLEPVDRIPHAADGARQRRTSVAHQVRRRVQTLRTATAGVQVLVRCEKDVVDVNARPGLNLPMLDRGKESQGFERTCGMEWREETRSHSSAFHVAEAVELLSFK